MTLPATAEILTVFIRIPFRVSFHSRYGSVPTIFPPIHRTQTLCIRKKCVYFTIDKTNPIHIKVRKKSVCVCWKNKKGTFEVSTWIVNVQKNVLHSYNARTHAFNKKRERYVWYVSSDGCCHFVEICLCT